MATPPPHHVTLESHVSPPQLHVPCHPAPLGYLGCQLYGPRSVSCYSSYHHNYENLIYAAFQHPFPQSFARAALSSQATGQRWEFRHFLCGGFSSPSRHVPSTRTTPRDIIIILVTFLVPTQQPLESFAFSVFTMFSPHSHACPAGTPCQLLPSLPGTYMRCKGQPAPITQQRHPNVQPQKDYDPKKHCLAGTVSAMVYT